MEKESVSIAIARVIEMEQLFDEITRIVDFTPNKLNETAVQKNVKKLSDYYAGEWLSDYELDEKGLLPKKLKRGVLSEDGLYDLLSEISAKTRGTLS